MPSEWYQMPQEVQELVKRIIIYKTETRGMGENPSDLSSHSNSEALPEDRYIQIKQM